MQQIEQSIDRYLAAMDSADRGTPEVAEAKAERLKEKNGTLKKQMQKPKHIDTQLHDSPDQQIPYRSRYPLNGHEWPRDRDGSAGSPLSAKQKRGRPRYSGRGLSNCRRSYLLARDQANLLYSFYGCRIP